MNDNALGGLLTDPDACAFIKVVAPKPEEYVLDLGWEGAALAPLMPYPGGKVWYVADDIRDVRQCRIEGVEAIHADSPVGGLPHEMGLVVYRPHQRAAKAQVFEWIDAGFGQLKVGGRLCLYGRKDRGVLSYARRLEAVFGNLTRGPRLGKGRAFWARKQTPLPCADPVDGACAFRVDDLPGGDYRFSTRPGVFSRDGVDPGSRLLIEHLEVDPRTRVLDLGCGWGLLGIVCARLAARGCVQMVDVSFRAVSCTQRNLSQNRVLNAQAEVGDGCEHAAGAYDLIVSNPPFHEGNAVGHAFINGASRLLRAGGRLMLVVMRPEPYLRQIRNCFKNTEVVARRDGYVVLAGY